MSNVVSARWIRLGGFLVLSLCWMNVSSQGLSLTEADPDAGLRIAAVLDDNGMSAVKRHKLDENLKYAAEDYRAGRFDSAVKWYRGATQLAPERTDIHELFNNAQRMLETQRREIDLLPNEPRERARLLEKAYDNAVGAYRKGRYDEARKVFYKLWVTVGDFKGKTLSMYRKTEKKLAVSEIGQFREGLIGHPADVPSDLLEAGSPAAPDSTQPNIPVDAQWLDQEVIKARAAIQTGYYEDARRILNEVLRHKPGHSDARKSLAYLDNQEQRVDLASTHAELQVVQALDVEVDLAITRSNRLFREAGDLYAQGELDEARSRLLETLNIFPDHENARLMLAQLDEGEDAVAEMPDVDEESTDKEARNDYFDDESEDKADSDDDKSDEETEEAYMEESQPDEVAEEAIDEEVDEYQPREQPSAELRRRARSMHEDAVELHNDGDVRGAREIWEEILELDPENDLASTYLSNTAAELRALESSESNDAGAADLYEQGQLLLNSPISISTDRKIPLEDFMNAISFATPIELQYYIADGAEADIYANFVDKPFGDVLDTVLIPIGMKWSKDDKNVITIEPALFSKTYSLSPVQISKLRELMDSGTLQKIIWTQLEAPAKGVEIILNERQNVLIVTGSERHLKKIESFLPSIEIVDTPDLVMKIYKIRDEDGPRIKSLINNIIRSSGESIFALERKVLIDGDDLIVRDIPGNITKIEELLLDGNFIQSLREQTLDIENFSLVPKDVENVQSDQIQVFTSRVVEAIKVFLYAQEGERRAADEGRRLWFDDATLQLTIVDTPTNLERVREYIESLPELGEQVHQKVIFLKYQEAPQLSSNLERILDITSGGSGSGAGGSEVIIKLRRGDEREIFNNIRLRVLRVEDNDEEDRNDDTVEVSISIPGLGPQNTTLQELDSQMIDDYEFTAEDVLPSAGLPGEGSARIRVRTIQTGLDAQALAANARAADSVQVTEDRGISITPFGDLNALIIRYTDPALYRDVLDLLDQLDIPTLQVAIETKFVEVNETRAKEFSAEFDIIGLGHGRDVDWTNTLVNTNFADNSSEFRDPFSPPVETLLNSNLIKGTTILDAVIGTIPNIQYQLRLLEAEGILNLVNGPRVLALNGEEAEFRIEQVTLDNQNNQDINDLVEFLSPFEDLEGQLADTDEATEDELVTAVVLRVTPSITSEDSIILRELSAEIIDFEGYMGEIFTPRVEDVDQITENTFFVPVVPQIAVSHQRFNMVQKRKKIITDARIKNGGTIIIGGWTGERTQELTSGVPVLRNLPYVGKLLFSRNQRTKDRTTLLIFLTGHLVE
jgi:type II secretory pathway component GspD/PulD (secretin)